MPTVTLTPNSGDGLLNGTTEVTIVPSPASGVNRLIRWVNIFNSDNKKITLYVQLANGGNRRTIFASALDPGDNFQLDSNDVLPLDSTSKSLVAKLGAAPNTQQPEWVTGWADQSIA